MMMPRKPVSATCVPMYRSLSRSLAKCRCPRFHAIAPPPIPAPPATRAAYSSVSPAVAPHAAPPLRNAHMLSPISEKLISQTTLLITRNCSTPTRSNSRDQYRIVTSATAVRIRSIARLDSK